MNKRCSKFEGADGQNPGPVSAFILGDLGSPSRGSWRYLGGTWRVLRVFWKDLGGLGWSCGILGRSWGISGVPWRILSSWQNGWNFHVPGHANPHGSAFQANFDELPKFKTSSNKIVMLSNDMGACLSIGSFKGCLGGPCRILGGSW